jgi:hypothetical protein
VPTLAEQAFGLLLDEARLQQGEWMTASLLPL